MDAKIYVTNAKGKLLSRNFKISTKFPTFRGKKLLILWLAESKIPPNKSACILDLRKFNLPVNDTQLIFSLSLEGKFPPLVRETLLNRLKDDPKSLSITTYYEREALAAIFYGSQDLENYAGKC